MIPITIKTTAGDGLVTHIVYPTDSVAVDRLKADGFRPEAIDQITRGGTVVHGFYAYEWIVGAVELEPYWKEAR